ncbi:MAG: glutamine-hydrolyzing carbamoyl-phosphate synthase small subunit [Bacteriovoracia bacterium]
MSLSKNRKSGALLLEDGTVFPGELFGADIPNLKHGVLGEVVFNTAMTGYQEILTDPSYLGQIVVMTYPHVGNYGINLEDIESRASFVSGFIAHEFCERPSNWRANEGLGEYFRAKGIPALSGVDTRALTRHLRDKGAMNAFLVAPAPADRAEADAVLKRLRNEPPFGDRDLVAEVTCREAYDWNKPHGARSAAWNTPSTNAEDSPLVVVMDLGVKHNMLRSLVSRGCRVKVVPAFATAEEILRYSPKGVMLTNGPGDPARVAKVPETVRALLGKVPIFGICMGHQILAHAIGAKTFKMKFGHHGANQPVLDMKTGRVMITSQNHGYAIDPETLPAWAKVAQINLNDQSVESIALPEHKAYSVQYHPEACPGPRDSMGYFDEFMKAMGYA